MKVTAIILNHVDDPFRDASVVTVPGHLEYEELVDLLLRWEKEDADPDDDEYEPLETIEEFDEVYDWTWQHLTLDGQGSSVVRS